ncbi:MAG: hypothetical protein O7E57_02210, partial [Gammaproteobacteria bacterium]|nr:hypothetical protein [Gammaproteobacteria bacterium]
VLKDYQSVMLGSAVATVSLSAGFAVWVLRSGALVLSLLGSSPMWRQFDPLPVLGPDDDDDDERWEDDLSWQEGELNDPTYGKDADKLFDNNKPSGEEDSNSSP